MSFGRAINPGGYPVTGNPGPKGADGKEIQLAVLNGFVVWKYLDSAIWTELIALADLQGPPGNDGSDGQDGATGNGIASITKTAGTGAPGTLDTYTITFTDGTTTTFQVRNGADGTNGIDGQDGADGQDGQDGRGITSIVRTSGTGAPGTTDTYTITFTDSSTATFQVWNGSNGTGTGDVSGPASSTPGTFAVYSGSTGKLLGTTNLTPQQILDSIATKAPLTGAGTSGTWPISITGSAASATNATNATNATYSNAASGPWVSAKVASTSADNTYSAVVTSPVGGSGDASLASLGFLNGSAYGIKLYLRADGYFGLGGWSRSPWSWYSAANGDMVAAGNVTAYSDPRLKENFERITAPMAILHQITGSTFTWRHGIPHISCKAGKRDYGIRADEVEAVMPEIVTRSIEIEGESYRTVSYEKLVPVLIEAVKNLDKRVKELEAQHGSS